MKNRRLCYLKGTEWKPFTSYRKMVEWAEDTAHDGTYYVSAPDITFQYTREQVLGFKRGKRNA